ncbi:MAG: 5'-3' exoribonuclease [Chlamydiae bacterium]|nr:5'-3' exoribonuclease [Chlamydiota bacterium]
MNFRADLHCHSTCSAGTLTPVEIIDLAKKVGLSGLSITDHDTVAAYETAIPYAKEVDILLGIGAEFSSVFKGVSVHVLGYDFELDHPAIKALCLNHKKRREGRNAAILEKLKRKGMPIEEEELGTTDKTIGRPHIALAMVERGYASSIQDAFNRFIGDGKSCFDLGTPISTEETLSAIHEAGGKAFVAHPHLMAGERLIKELLSLPFDGIECYYSRMPPHREKPWVKLAEGRGLLKSGGSDFHGSVKPQISLGCSWVDEATFRSLFTRCL